jgi:hypothetical protein
MIFIVNHLVVLVIVWFLLGLVFSIYSENHYDDNWRWKLYAGIDKCRKWFGINLFYEIFKILVFIVWVCLYPVIFIVKFFIVDFDILWLFKKVE